MQITTVPQMSKEVCGNDPNQYNITKLPYSCTKMTNMHSLLFPFFFNEVTQLSNV